MSSMSRTYWLVAAMAATTLLGGEAAAQTVTMACSPGPDTSSGTIQGTISLAAVMDPRATPVVVSSISSTYAGRVFGRAECDCDTSDVFARIQLSTCLNQGASGSATVWVGTSACSDFSVRTAVNQTQCQKYPVTTLSNNSFNAGGGNCGTTNYLDVLIPSRALFSPNLGSCDITSATNQLFIFVGASDTNLAATCTLALTEQAAAPAAAVNVNSASGEGAMTISWDSPPAGTSLQPTAFQVLCDDGEGNPIPDHKFDPVYSVCLQDGIHRRQNMFGVSNISAITDGGTRADLGLGTSSFGLSQGGSQQAFPHASDDMGTDDMGVDMSVGVDMSATTSLKSGKRPTISGLPAPFDHLDPAFVVTDRIPAGTSYSPRIENLENNRTYRCTVVSIDDFGNATASPIVEGTPKPVDDLYNRYRASGGTAQGFCFVATAAYGDYDHPQVKVLRAFRDLVLEQSALGHAFVGAYYATSPPLARFIAGGDVRRTIARGVLWPLVGVAMLALELHSLFFALLVVVGGPTVITFLWRRRSRRRRTLQEVAA